MMKPIHDGKLKPNGEAGGVSRADCTKCACREMLFDTVADKPGSPVVKYGLKIVMDSQSMQAKAIQFHRMMLTARANLSCTENLLRCDSTADTSTLHLPV